MKQLVLFLLFFLIFCAFSCRNGKHDKVLIHVDSLQAVEYNDSALRLLEDFDLSNLTRSDSAYYFMLSNFVRFKMFKPIEKDSTINYSIRYYESIGDKINLARSYVYKASIIEKPDRYAEMAILLKRAEDLTKSFGKDANLDLLLRIYSNLAYVNSSSKNFLFAKEYCSKALELARKLKSKRWIGYSNLELSYIYSGLGDDDSASICLRNVESCIDEISKGEQSVYFQQMALEYSKTEKYDSAILFLKRALDIYPTADIYGTLAGVYMKNNSLNEANLMWEKAFRSSQKELQVSYMKPYAEWLYKIGDRDSAWNVAMKIPVLKDSLMHVYKAETVLAEQNRYDRHKANMVYLQRQRMLFSVLVIVIILLLLVAVIAYAFSLRHKKIVADGLRRRAELKTTISDYERLVKRLRYEGKSHTKEMKAMQRKLDTLRTEQNKILYLGKTNYDWIESGGTTGKWRINDFRAYLEYYRTMDLPFLLHLEVEYDSLSPTQMFHLVLEHMGKSKDEIMRIMNFNANSFRVARSRILHKRVVEHF